MTAGTGDHELTIDELARQTGVTVRTIRDHQTRGLLAPPAIRGRIGYYGTEHVARLQLIREMQADGFNLAAIRAVLENSPEGSEVILDFRHALRAPFEAEQSIVMSEQEIVDAFGGERLAWALNRAQELGLIVALGDGRWEVPSPTVLQAGTATLALGVPLEAALELVAELKRHTDAAANAFVELFIEHIWRPHEAAGQPGEQWPALADALQQLRPLAAQTVLGLFGPSMTAAVERGDQRETARERRRATRRAKNAA
jgi:DNA-binding transcriptional MerR regulator